MKALTESAKTNKLFVRAAGSFIVYNYDLTTQ